MQPASILTTAALILATIGAAPLAADPGRGKGADHPRHLSDCPPGLAKKSPPCMPPGQVRKHPPHYGNRVGEVLRIGDYVLIRDPGRHDLEQRAGWRYYQGDDRIYRVDGTTHKVLAVLNLIDAFAN